MAMRPCLDEGWTGDLLCLPDHLDVCPPRGPRPRIPHVPQPEEATPWRVYP